MHDLRSGHSWMPRKIGIFIGNCKMKHSKKHHWWNRSREASSGRARQGSVSKDTRPFGHPWGKGDLLSFVPCDCGLHWKLFVKGCGYVGQIGNRQFELLTSNDAATREIFPAAQKSGWEGVRRIVERLEVA